MNHQQLNSMMPQSKSSVGEDISSSFVSSATESEAAAAYKKSQGGAPPQGRPLTYEDVVNQDYNQ